MLTPAHLQCATCFQHFSDEDCVRFLDAVPHSTRCFAPGETVFLPGTTIRRSALILSGHVHICHAAGDTETIAAVYGPGELIGCSFELSGAVNDCCCIRAAVQSQLLFFSILDFIRSGTQLDFYSRFIEDFLRSYAQAPISLNRTIQVMSEKTLREKLLRFFSDLSRDAASRRFYLSLNQEQLAQRIGSERSSVCRELGKLRQERILKLENGGGGGFFFFSPPPPPRFSF
jgi:transcriptional regulator, crp/fnr family